MLLFAILAATITYQAGLTPPGGFLLCSRLEQGVEDTSMYVVALIYAVLGYFAVHMTLSLCSDRRVTVRGNRAAKEILRCDSVSSVLCSAALVM